MTIPTKNGTPPANTQHSIPQSDSSVYARLLLPKGHGYPLWIPETDVNLPLEYRRYGVRIGDVGIVTEDGGFDYLFNICLPGSDLVNKGRVPRDFKPLDASLDIRTNPSRFKPGADISSAYIKKTKTGETSASSGYVFTTSCKEGAVLVLPEGGSRTDLRNQAEFRRYASQNAATWYQHVNAELGWETSNGSMYLVTGCDKTSSWGNAAFSHLPIDGDVTIEFAPKQTDASKTQYIWTKDGSASVRYGPDVADKDVDGHPNQCIFIRGFRICINPTIFANSFNKEGSTEASGSRRQANHPSTIVNDFIFSKTSGVDVVLANDDQWASLLGENDTIIPENEELIRRTFNKFNLVVTNGVAHFEPTPNDVNGHGETNQKSNDADQTQGKPKLAISTKNEANGIRNHIKLPSKSSLLSPHSASLGMSAAELLRLQQNAPAPSPTSYRQMASNDLVAKSPLRSRALASSPLALSPTVRFAETYGGSSKDSSVASSPQLDPRARVISPQNILQPSSAGSADSYPRVIPATVPSLANGMYDGQDAYGQDLGANLVMAHARALQPQYLGPYYIVSPQIDGGFQSPASQGSSVNSQDTRFSGNRNPGLYKTELCRSWGEKGWCRYGAKCQFAHGQEDLRPAVRHPKYKTEICRTFWASGTCPYGNRCCFVHTEVPGAQPPDANKANGQVSGSGGNSDSEKDSGSILSRIAIRTQDLSTSESAPSSAGGNTSAISGRPKGSLRIDTSSLDGPSVQNKSAFPSFTRNQDRLPPSGVIKSPAAVTAGVVWDDPSRRVVR